MRIREFQYIKGLNDFRMIAGNSGLNNKIENIVIFEYENMNTAADNYYRGDFIVSTLLFANGCPELIVSTITRLMNMGISGLAIKAASYHALPPELSILADDNGIPLYVFKNTYIEDVIVNVNDYMKAKKNYLKYEKDFQEIIYNQYSLPQAIEKATTINPSHKQKAACMYLMPENSSDYWIIEELLNESAQRKNKTYINAGYVLYRFEEGLFILHNFNEDQSSSYIEQFRALLIRLHITETKMKIGISQIHPPVKELDLCIKECYFACCYSWFKHTSLTVFSEIGIYQILLPMLFDRCCRQYYEVIIRKIMDYDQLNRTTMLDTLQEYVKSGYNIKLTAEILYQHPNTIRYRIQRAADIIHGECGKEDLHSLYIAVLMHMIRQDSYFISREFIL